MSTEEKLNLYDKIFSQLYQWILSGYWEEMNFDGIPERIITAMQEEDFSLVETLLEENQEYDLDEEDTDGGDF